MSVLIHGSRTVWARANWGRWIADCARCQLNAWEVYPGDPAWYCLACDTTNEIRWPPDDMIRGVERLLMMRPNVKTRSWHPGETLHDLMRENGELGVFDHLDQLQLDAPPGTDLLTVHDHRITADLLPVLPRPLKAVDA